MLRSKIVGPNFLSLGMLICGVLVCAAPRELSAQRPSVRYGSEVPADVKMIYERGLEYLVKTQQPSGSWSSSASYGHYGAGEHGITGMCVMAFMASGEDPNFGRYANNVRKAVKSMIIGQDPSTGYMGSSMYHHGFATLGLSEAYGAVDDTLVWDGSESKDRKRSIGEALELAVRCAVTSQKNNSVGGWRYSPQDRSADTSVSGAVLMGLLAARNAGIEVPDACIEKALAYFRSMTSDTGMVGYSGAGGFGTSMNRSSIGTLVCAIGKKKDWKEYKATLEHISSRLEHQEGSYPFYFRFYMAQALFQGDFEAWTKWNRENIRMLKELQQDDGSFQGNHGQAYATAMSMLALALNYRFLPIYER